MALLDFVRRACRLPKNLLKSLIICNYPPTTTLPEDISDTHHHYAPGPVARLPPFVKVNSAHTHAQRSMDEIDWSKLDVAFDSHHDETRQPTSHLIPALSLRQAARLPHEQPHYLLPCEKPRSSAQTMLRRQTTLKILEGNVPMEVGEETRWYGSTRRERLEERQWMMRRERIQKGVMMLDERISSVGGNRETTT